MNSKPAVSPIFAATNPKFFLWAVVVLHLVLAAGYARVTPYRTAGLVATERVYVQDIGAPDERQHVNYVAHVLSGKGLPVFNPRDRRLYESYQSHQPPLFYLLAAGYCRTLGIGDPTSRTSGFLLRLLNAAIGAAGVLGVWCLALWGLRSKAIAAVAAVIAGLLPMNLALSGAVSNDPLLICLCTWCLAFCVKGVREGWSLRAAIWVGVIMGLAFLTKTTAIALLPMVALSFFLRPPVPAGSSTDVRSGRRGDSAALKRGADKGGTEVPHSMWHAIFLRFGLVAVGIGVLLALPWWIRNQALYGDPLAIKAFNQAFVGSMQASRMTEIVGGPWNYWANWVGAKTVCSFFGVFGYWDVWLSGWVYDAAAAVCIFLAVGCGLSIRGRREDRPVHLLCGLFAMLVLASFVRFNMQYFQAQGRYLLPALGPIAVGLATGLVFLARKRAEIATVGVAIALLAVNVYVLRTLPGEFAARTSAPAPSAGLRQGD